MDPGDIPDKVTSNCKVDKTIQDDQLQRCGTSITGLHVKHFPNTVGGVSFEVKQQVEELRSAKTMKLETSSQELDLKNGSSKESELHISPTRTSQHNIKEFCTNDEKKRDQNVVHFSNSDKKESLQNECSESLDQKLANFACKELMEDEQTADDYAKEFLRYQWQRCFKKTRMVDNFYVDKVHRIIEAKKENRYELKNLFDEAQIPDDVLSKIFENLYRSERKVLLDGIQSERWKYLLRRANEAQLYFCGNDSLSANDKIMKLRRTSTKCPGKRQEPFDAWGSEFRANYIDHALWWTFKAPDRYTNVRILDVANLLGMFPYLWLTLSDIIYLFK